MEQPLYVLNNNGLLTSNNKEKLLKISLSTRNLVAFTSANNINSHSNLPNQRYFCYVADINSPWFTYQVGNANHYPISVLEWDMTSIYLLVGDSVGSVKIFAQKDHLLSEWIQLYKVDFPGEHIIRGIFFHNGRKITYNHEKKDVSYTEKFSKASFSPSVRQFGGVPTAGVLIISATGMIGSFIIPHEPHSASVSSPIKTPHILPSSTESLGSTRNFFTTADIAYSKNGEFLVAITNNTNSNCNVVQCFQIKLTLTNSKLEVPTISCKSFPSFFFTEGCDFTDVSITGLNWSSHEDPDCLIVSASHSGGAIIESWALVEKATPIHKIFQTTKGEVFKSLSWLSQHQYRYTSKIVGVGVTKTKLSPSSYLYLAMQDNTIQCLLKDNMKRVSAINLNVGWRPENNENSAKQLKLSINLEALDLTWMGHLLFAVDSVGQLYAVKVLPIVPNSPSNHVEHYSPVQIVNLLEYCLVTGVDYLDILLTTKISNFDVIVDRLTENFNRQMSVFQQHYYVNFLTMKANLFRFSLSGQSKAQDLTSLLMLHSILIAFKSLLRPSDLTSHDKGPAENLAMVLSESNTDVDKVLLNLEGKDFTVEQSTLQSLQQLIQWVADLTLNILAKLPENRANAAKNTGYDISRDLVALNSIRELLVMIRIWGLVNEKCLPEFSRFSDNFDILSTVFRLVSRLALNPNEPDDLLLDECCVLPNQVIIPSIQSVSTRTAVSSPFLHQMSHPIYLEYNVEPECFKFCPDLDSGVTTVVDSIRYLQLGKKPSLLRKCTRCGALSCTGSIAKTAAMKAWEQRWTVCNRCGGFWRLHNV